MDYIEIRENNSLPSIHFRSEMWIFLVLTVILLLFTFGAWAYSERNLLSRKLQRLSKKRRKDESEA